MTAVSLLNKVCIRFLKAVPQLQGVDGLTYGSFSVGEFSELPEANASVLIARGAAVNHDPDLFTSEGYLKSNNQSGYSDKTNNWLQFYSKNGCVSCQLGLSTVPDADGAKNASLLSKDAVINSSDLSWQLPGQKEEYLTCGTVNFGVKCSSSSCDHKELIYHHCDRPECPVCHPYYAKSLGNDIAKRLDGCNLAYLDVGIKNGYFKHWVFSPEQKEAIELCKSVEGYKKLRSQAVSNCKLADVKGAALVFHYYRVSDPIKDLLNNAGYGIGFKNGSKGTLWEGVLSDALNLGSVNAYVYPSPHFHVVGVGFTINSDVFYKETNWTYKHIRTIKCKPKDTVKELSKVTSYICSHSTRLELLGDYKTHPNTYFGIFSYNKVKVSKESYDIVNVTCPKCESNLIRCGYIDDPYLEGTPEYIDWNNELEPYTQKECHRWYELRDPPG